MKQLYLYGRVQVADLVQKECAAVSKLYATRLRTISASESTFFIAEELTFNQSPWDGRATNLHKRSVSQWRLGMNQLCQHFLPGAALPSEQDCYVGTCSLFQFLTDFAHGRGVSKDHLIRRQTWDWLHESCGWSHRTSHCRHLVNCRWLFVDPKGA